MSEILPASPMPWSPVGVVGYTRFSVCRSRSPYWSETTSSSVAAVLDGMNVSASPVTS